jgi:hypothetical protein
MSSLQSSYGLVYLRDTKCRLQNSVVGFWGSFFSAVPLAVVNLFVKICELLRDIQGIVLCSVEHMRQVGKSWGVNQQ